MSMLAKYATLAQYSQGRKFTTENSPTRTQFQRDRDRIIHSTAFRRLQYKTQVFVRHEGKHFRTRLTHTLEVSQIARSISRALKVDEDLAEAIALAHDLGHPPFGHAGERVLDKKMQIWGGFEHNLQSLRTVTKLEKRYAEHDGLNLTWECLEGILKHNGPIINEKNKEKLSFINYLEPETYAGLEAQIAAIADDIAYNAHDIDDGLRAGLIKLGDLMEVEILAPIVKTILHQWPHISEQRQAHEVQRRLITATIEDVITSSRENIIRLNPQNVNQVRNAGKQIIIFSEKFTKLEKELKQFMYKNIYNSSEVKKDARRGEKIIAKLFDFLIQTPILPKDWQNKFDLAKNEKKRARIICDYIAGMTDQYAIDLYEQIFDEKVKLS